MPTFSLEWDATDNYINKVEDGVKGANLYLMTGTDGYSYIENVDIYDDGNHWDNCNVRIYDENANDKSDDGWPRANVGDKWDGEMDWGILADDEVRMPREWVGYEQNQGYWYSGLVHELGHYVFGFWDEYEKTDALGTEFEDIGLEGSLMDDSKYYMSYKDMYNNGEPYTQQMANNQESCWEYFVDYLGTDGNEDQKINFQSEAEQDDYRPWASYNGIQNVPVDVNYLFSANSWYRSDTYTEIRLDYPPTIDITQSMNINDYSN